MRDTELLREATNLIVCGKLSKVCDKLFGSDSATDSPSSLPAKRNSISLFSLSVSDALEHRDVPSPNSLSR